MADMTPTNAWLIAAIALLPALAATGWATLSGGLARRLVALELSTTLASLVLVLLTIAFDQPSFVDLALTLVFLAFPGTLLYAHFLERWL